MAVTVDVPNLEELTKKAFERTVVKATLQVEADAKISAPVDTGFYRANIKSDIVKGTITAMANYSRFIEYGTRYQAPRPIMRNAGRKVQKEIGQIFVREFQRV